MKAISSVVTCSFDGCSSELITINTNNLDSSKQKYINLPKEFFNKYKLYTKNDIQNDKESSDMNNFFITDSFWDFDNIGVSRSIQSLKLDENEDDKQKTLIHFDDQEYNIVYAAKYLVCADCDRGPIGMILKLRKHGDNNSDDTREICLLSLDSVNVREH